VLRSLSQRLRSPHHGRRTETPRAAFCGWSRRRATSRATPSIIVLQCAATRRQQARDTLGLIGKESGTCQPSEKEAACGTHLAIRLVPRLPPAKAGIVMRSKSERGPPAKFPAATSLCFVQSDYGTKIPASGCQISRNSRSGAMMRYGTPVRSK
jgi:hypothetical protein